MREITEVRLIYRGAFAHRYGVHYTCQLTSKKPRNLRLTHIFAADEMAAYVEALFAAIEKAKQ